MEHTIGKIPLLAASISLGLILGTAATKPALAGSFNKNIVDNSNQQIIGSLNFAWDDSKVKNNSLKSFSDLTSFNYTNAQAKSFDLGFVSTAMFKTFAYDLSSGKVTAVGYNTAGEQTGFYALPNAVAKDLSVISPIFVTDFSLVNPPAPPLSPAGAPPAPSSSPPVAAAAEAIPEPSSVFGLFAIAGLGLGMSTKKLSK